MPLTPHPPSAFIRRCWYSARGCGESSACEDIRKVFNTREVVDKLPADCHKARYVVTGSAPAFRHGVTDHGRVETLAFPGEEWHKCCLSEGPAAKMLCEKAEAIPRTEVLREHGGVCGTKNCMGIRDRCLVVGRRVKPGFKPKRAGDCPASCPGSCDRVTQSTECVHIGDEPPLGQEGEETPQSVQSGAEPYEVYALAMPDTAWLLELPPLRRPRRRAVCRAWTDFLG